MLVEYVSFYQLLYLFRSSHQLDNIAAARHDFRTLSSGRPLGVRVSVKYLRLSGGGGSSEGGTKKEAAAAAAGRQLRRLIRFVNVQSNGNQPVKSSLCTYVVYVFSVCCTCRVAISVVSFHVAIFVSLSRRKCTWCPRLVM